MQQQVYHSRDIQAWEQRWFSKQNSSYGLMQQVALTIALKLQKKIESLQIKRIAIWCGSGNNAGDGYCVAAFLKQWGYQVDIFAAKLGDSKDLQQAYAYALQNDVRIHEGFEINQIYDCHIDALFGIGLNRQLDEHWQTIIDQYNQQSGLKIAIDIPSGLNANTGQPLPVAIKANITYTVLGRKAGLYTGQGKEYTGDVNVITLIPVDEELPILAKLTDKKTCLPSRQAFGHKGSYGHVLVVGGHKDMGGAVIMAAEAAFAAGAGKVTVVCDARHHTSILSRAPNIMLRDINVLDTEHIQVLLDQVDAVCFGMGLGRDEWAEKQYQLWYPLIRHTSDLEVVLDADALWFLAQTPNQLDQHIYATPHSGEAAKLLACSVQEVESDRISAIRALQLKYAGQWVLKGSGSLILENELWICTQGNAGMGTGGMGDVLAGMIASLKAQFHEYITLHDIVTLHAQAGDVLAESGQRGLQAQNMTHAIYKVVNR
nr:NAD(P)H-hydrate dehydratase [Acinetobacter sp. Marseille-Q1620]